MIIAGFFLLLAIAIAVRFLVKRLLPLALPKSRLKAIALGWLAGLAASLLERLLGPWEPEVAGVHMLAAFVGASVAIVGWGIWPFVAIFLGLKRKRPGRRRARNPTRGAAGHD